MAVTLIGSPYVNPAGLNKTSSPQDNFVNALNYYGVKSGSIKSPDAGVVASADAFDPKNPNQKPDDHPILSANGLWVSSASGAPWHGEYDGPGGAKQFYSNGHVVQDVGMVGTQQPNISVQKIEKNPALSSQVAGAISANGEAANLFNKSFGDYLKEAQAAGKEASAAIGKTPSINADDTIARMNQDVVDANLQGRGTLNRFQTAENQVLADQAARNSLYQQTQDSAVTGLEGTLQSQQADYAQAARNVAQQAYANAMKQVNLYHLTSPTPTSGSGQLSNRYIAAYNNVELPLEQQLAQMNLERTNQIYGLRSGLQDKYYGQDSNLLGQRGALASDVASRENSLNQYLTGLDQNTAQYIQSLRTQIATMEPQLALSYLQAKLQAIGQPIQLAQSIMDANIARLGSLNALDQATNTYNLYSPYQNNAPTYQVPSINIPASPGATSTSNGGGGSLLAQSQGLYNQFADQQQNWLNTDAGRAWQASQRVAAPVARPGVDYGQTVAPGYSATPSMQWNGTQYVQSNYPIVGASPNGNPNFNPDYSTM